jgi:hypothetical protein
MKKNYAVHVQGLQTKTGLQSHLQCQNNMKLVFRISDDPFLFGATLAINHYLRSLMAIVLLDMSKHKNRTTSQNPNTV